MKDNARLLAPAPLLSLLERVSNDRTVLERTIPSSDAARLLREIETLLDSAIEEASNADTFVSIERLHELTGRPESTLRRLCQRYGEIMGARKISGSWTIDWNKFEKAWNSGRLESVEFAA